MKRGYILIFFILGFHQSWSQQIARLWKTIDDETGKPRSVVEIKMQNGKCYGKIIKLFRESGEDQDPLCKECSGAKYNQKIIGLEIISDMQYDKDDKEYSGGEILDPESGNVYDCKLWIDESGKLKVRGYLMFLYRTQTWEPYEP